MKTMKKMKRQRSISSILRVALIAAALIGGVHHVFAAPEHSGQVTFGGLPLPGATVTASSGDKRLVTNTDEQGVFKLADIADGVWTVRVEMLGFVTMERQVEIGSTAAASEAAALSLQPYDLKLKPFDEITRGLPPPSPIASTTPRPSTAGPQTGPRQSSGQPGQPAAAPSAQRGFQRAGVTASPTPPQAAAANRAGRPAAPAADEPSAAAEAGPGAADGFLINGSVNNGAASPFAQAAAFGNNRRGRGSLFNGGLAIVSGSSRFDSRPFTFAGQPASKPDYNDIRVIGTFAGPLRFSKLFGNRNDPSVFVAFQHADDHNATTQPGVMPTSLERAGDFSQSRDAFGRSFQVLDPTTGRPFPGNVIPSERISPQAAALLGYYPQPNFDGGTAYNFQAPLIAGTRQDLVTTRVMQSINNRNQLIGTFAYQRTSTDQTTLFGFQDASAVSGVDTALTWTHRVNQFFSMRLRY